MEQNIRVKAGFFAMGMLAVAFYLTCRAIRNYDDSLLQLELVKGMQGKAQP